MPTAYFSRGLEELLRDVSAEKEANVAGRMSSTSSQNGRHHGRGDRVLQSRCKHDSEHSNRTIMRGYAPCVDQVKHGRDQTHAGIVPGNGAPESAKATEPKVNRCR